MAISLPQYFADKLDEDQSLKGPVFSALHSFGSWFETSGRPVFFQDYTDHGPKHIEDVLATAEKMLPEIARSILSPADVAVLVYATLLHDSAMYLAEPGFERIIKETRERCRCEVDRKSWPTLWREFIFSAQRWSVSRIASVIGDVGPEFQLTDPFERWGNLRVSDYKIVGEFVRIHHPRLAHEFAVGGVPGVDPEFLQLPSEVSSDWKDIAGMVARSHGMPLRKCVDYISRKYHARDYQGIHAVYLMALLRLSDYLQIQSRRAPSIIFGYRVLPSRVSEVEWRVHNSIRNITPQSDDPESVEIDASPDDIDTFLRLKSWLEGIQSELDVSWAVLGEVYGRFSELQGLGLHWRRVRSNIDDVDVFSREVKYLPRKIRLEVSRSELLALLAKPLYGDDPSFGARELIQNALDAVREREHYVSVAGLDDVPRRTDSECDISISVVAPGKDGGLGVFEIIDNGIGMMDETLINYFFTAGASFRSSGQWQQLFERDLNANQTGPRSQVARSGRFGVGVLAAFLIGHEVRVETRHITEDHGFKCSIRLSDEAVQVERDGDLEIGTKISIPIDDKTFRQLERSEKRVSRPAMWEWCVLDRPSVQRRVSSEEGMLEQTFGFNLAEWKDVGIEGPLSVQWAFKSSAPRLSCNGIFISNSAKLPSLGRRLVNTAVVPVTPAIHVLDPDGVLPLSLTRKDLVADAYGFESELAESISKDFKLALRSLPQEFNSKFLGQLQRIPHFSTAQTFKDSARFTPDIIVTKDGFAFATSEIINNLNAKRFLWLTNPYEDTRLLAEGLDAADWDCVFVQGRSMDSPQHGSLKKLIATPFLEFDAEKLTKENATVIGVRSNRRFRSRPANDDTKPRNSKVFVEKTEHLTLHRVFTEVERGKGSELLTLLTETTGMRESKYPFPKLLVRWKQRAYETVAEVVLEHPLRVREDDSGYGMLWTELFGDKLLPWSSSGAT